MARPGWLLGDAEVCVAARIRNACPPHRPALPWRTPPPRALVVLGPRFARRSQSLLRIGDTQAPVGRATDAHRSHCTTSAWPTPKRRPSSTRARPSPPSSARSCPPAIASSPSTSRAPRPCLSPASEAFAPDIVFNLAEGHRGKTRRAFYPALFEELGIPSTGSDAYTLCLTLDKTLTKKQLAG